MLEEDDRIRNRNGKIHNHRTDPSISGLTKKLQDNCVKINILVARLRALDLNMDGYVHISDLEELLIEYLGVEQVSRREVDNLARLLGSGEQKGTINYSKLIDIFNFDDKTSQRTHDLRITEETWYDPAEVLARREKFERGSVGDWLQNASCPSEIKNFRRFIQCLEEYERMSGLKCIPEENGFVIPLGPDLKAHLSFCMNG